MPGTQTWSACCGCSRGENRRRGTRLLLSCGLPPALHSPFLLLPPRLPPRLPPVDVVAVLDRSVLAAYSPGSVIADETAERSSARPGALVSSETDLSRSWALLCNCHGARGVSCRAGVVESFEGRCASSSSGRGEGLTLLNKGVMSEARA